MIKTVGRAVDITGKKYGMLTVIGRAEDYVLKSGKIKTRWICKCDCGKEVVVTKNALSSGITKSCGCLRDKINSERLKKKNRYDLSGQYGIGYDSNYKEFYFDLEDYDKIKDIFWFVNDHGYVMNSKNQSMHRFLYPNFDVIDHINHRTNDNRKCNLRNTTTQQNIMNSRLHNNNTSGVTGVTWHKNDKKWQAQIVINNKNLYLGSYINKEDAIKARKEAEEKYFGEYSYSNSILKGAEQIC